MSSLEENTLLLLTSLFDEKKVRQIISQGCFIEEALEEASLSGYGSVTDLLLDEPSLLIIEKLFRLLEDLLDKGMVNLTPLIRIFESLREQISLLDPKKISVNLFLQKAVSINCRIISSTSDGVTLSYFLAWNSHYLIEDVSINEQVSFSLQMALYNVLNRRYPPIDLIDFLLTKGVLVTDRFRNLFNECKERNNQKDHKGSSLIKDGYALYLLRKHYGLPMNRYRGPCHRALRRS